MRQREARPIQTFVTVGVLTGTTLVFLPEGIGLLRPKNRWLYEPPRPPDEVEEKPRFGLEHLKHAATIRKVVEDVKQEVRKRATNE